MSREEEFVLLSGLHWVEEMVFDIYRHSLGNSKETEICVTLASATVGL
jgi:hypothetical protein